MEGTKAPTNPLISAHAASELSSRGGVTTVGKREEVVQCGDEGTTSHEEATVVEACSGRHWKPRGA